MAGWYKRWALLTVHDQQKKKWIKWIKEESSHQFPPCLNHATLDLSLTENIILDYHRKGSPIEGVMNWNEIFCFRQLEGRICYLIPLLFMAEERTRVSSGTDMQQVTRVKEIVVLNVPAEKYVVSCFGVEAISLTRVTVSASHRKCRASIFLKVWTCSDHRPLT